MASRTDDVTLREGLGAPRDGEDASPAVVVASPSLIEATVVPASASSSVVDDSPDELPAVGKVAADGATRSMWQAFKKAGTASAGAGGAAIAGREEPSHLAQIRSQAITRLPPSRVGMFESARFTAWSDETGVATLWFPHDAVSAANYVRKFRAEYEAAFTDQLRQQVTFALEIEPEPAVVAEAVADRKPRVVRPKLDDVAAELPDEPARPGDRRRRRQRRPDRRRVAQGLRRGAHRQGRVARRDAYASSTPMRRMNAIALSR